MHLAVAAGQGSSLLVAERQETLPWLGTTEESSNTPGSQAGKMGYRVMVFDATPLALGEREHALQLTLSIEVSDIYSPGQPGGMLLTPTGPTPTPGWPPK